MRVVHVMHSMSFGGAEVLVNDFIRATQGECEHAIVCLDDIGPLGVALREDSVRVDVIGRKGGVEPRVIAQMHKSLREIRPDVVIGHQYGPYSYAAMALAVRLRRPGLIFVEHGRHYPDTQRPKRILINRGLFLGYTQRVVAVCGYIKRLLIENEGIPASRIDVVYNGVEPSRFEKTHSATEREAFRSSLGISPGELAVTCVARFHPVKDHPTLVRGFALASREVPNARLVLVGGGDDSHLRALCSELGITERVTFTGVRKDIPEVYAASDLFSMSSLSEGTSVTLLESMLSRRACVVTDVGGNPEIVDRNETGLLVPRGDHTALGQRVAELLKDPERRAQMGERGRARVLQYFTKDKMHGAWLGMIAQSTPKSARR